MTNERKEYVDPDLILTELKTALDSHSPGEIDWVTFVGSGEPTLHSRLGYLLRQVKQVSKLPVAVITNGALLHLPEVRQELLPADAVLPSLDAGNASLYRQINRPHPHVPFNLLITGLITFRHEYSGKLWIEVMMVKGLNDSEPALREIASILDQVEPDEIHINQPIRPPAEPWVQPTDEEGLMRARAILGDKVRLFTFVEGDYELDEHADVVDAILAIITRHPMRQGELEQTLSVWSQDEVSLALQELDASNRAQIVERYGVKFWSAVESYYSEDG